MVKMRISGSKESTDVFAGEIFGMIVHNNLKGGTNGKEYPNTDFTLRRYFDLDLLEFTGELEAIKDEFLVSLRISGSDDELKKMLEILKQLGVVYFKPTKKGEIKVTKRDYGNTIMISCANKSSADKRKLLLGDLATLK